MLLSFVSDPFVLSVFWSGDSVLFEKACNSAPYRNSENMESREIPSMAWKELIYELIYT